MSGPQPGGRNRRVPGVEAPTEKLRVLGTTAGQLDPRPSYAAPRTPGLMTTSPTMAAVERLWLRCAVVIAGAIGIAMVAIGVATYLMAVDSNAAAWVFYVLAGLVTLAMPAAPWFYLRELRALLDEPGRVVVAASSDGRSTVRSTVRLTSRCAPGARAMR